MHKPVQSKTIRRRVKHNSKELPVIDKKLKKLTPKKLTKTLEEEFDLFPSESEDMLRDLGIYYITGEISTDDLKDIHQDIIAKDLAPYWNKDVQLIVNSIGGEISEGWMLVDLLDCIRMDVRTVGMGEICSLGTMLVAAGTRGKRVVSASCSLMIHGFSMGMEGNRQQLIDTFGFVEREHEREIEFWVQRSNLKREDVSKLFLDGRDHYFTPKEALQLGIIDEIVGPKKGLKA